MKKPTKNACHCSLLSFPCNGAHMSCNVLFVNFVCYFTQFKVPEFKFVFINKLLIYAYC